MNNLDNIVEIIKRIWKEELSVENFTVNDDFFELGGNSLKLISILDKLQRNEKLKNMNDLTVLELFDNPSITDLSRVIQSKIENS